MTERTIKILGSDHRLTIERKKGRVIVTLSGRVIAEGHCPLQRGKSNAPRRYHGARNGGLNN